MSLVLTFWWHEPRAKCREERDCVGWRPRSVLTKASRIAHQGRIRQSHPRWSLRRLLLLSIPSRLPLHCTPSPPLRVQTCLCPHRGRGAGSGPPRLAILPQAHGPGHGGPRYGYPSAAKYLHALYAPYALINAANGSSPRRAIDGPLSMGGPGTPGVWISNGGFARPIRR